MLKEIKTTYDEPSPVAEIVELLPSYWEGEMRGTKRSARFFETKFCAHLALGENLIGSGETEEFPARYSALHSFDVSGGMVGSAVRMTLLHNADFLGGVPFECEGFIDDSQSHIFGSFSIECFSGPTCGCKGGEGVFFLHRVEKKRKRSPSSGF